MKKFIKNTVLSFVIVYTILNVLLFVNFMVLKNSMLREVVTLYLSENRDIEASAQLEQDTLEQINEMKEQYGEEIPATGLIGIRQLMIGMNVITGQQLGMLIISLILSVAIGIILSLTEKSKTKAIVYFISIGLILAILYTLIDSLPGTNYFGGIVENFIYTITDYVIPYIIIYLFIYVVRFFIDKKKMKELNKEIEKKNK